MYDSFVQLSRFFQNKLDIRGINSPVSPAKERIFSISSGFRYLPQRITLHDLRCIIPAKPR